MIVQSYADDCDKNICIYMTNLKGVPIHFKETKLLDC